MARISIFNILEMARKRHKNLGEQEFVIHLNDGVEKIVKELGLERQLTATQVSGQRYYSLGQNNDTSIFTDADDSTIKRVLSVKNVWYDGVEIDRLGEVPYQVDTT
jgi:hypothetical protein|tara:strand:+ start:17585 stop:17902 length:318 start_codon:yes stop_codon:yes gene_type:complete